MLTFTFILILTRLALIAASSGFAAEVSAVETSCLHSCGNITNISFPFNVSNNLTSCSPSYMDNPYLHLLCNQTEGKLYALSDPVYTEPDSQLTRLEVLSIRTDSLIVQIAIATADKGISQMVPNEFNCTDGENLQKALILPPIGQGPYILSDENKFGTFGCSMGTISTSDLINHDSNATSDYGSNVSSDYNYDYTYVDYYDHVVGGGCTVLLPNNRINAECGNHTCCVASLPPSSELHLRYAYYYTSYADTTLNGFNLTGSECNCSNNYATLFHSEFTDFDNRLFRLKIVWALPVVMNYTTDPTSVGTDDELTHKIMESPYYACTTDQTSDFVRVPEVPGYRCKCRDGFVGDGYTNGTRCTNVDECASPSSNACVSHSTCVDTFGNYMCTCNSRFNVGDGRKDGSGCTLSPWIHKLIIILPASLGFLIMIFVIIMLMTLWTKRMKRKNFVQNGGLQLQEFMRSRGCDNTFIEIFTESEMKVATNNYADDMKIGTGGYGAVYKGILEGGKLVAVKKALVQEDEDNKEFLNELSILMQIHHKHIVKLLGCCLETKTPLLVYEYASNGTLGDHLQETSKSGYLMGWDRRLVVAIQTAEALSYLHRAASPPILHRDVKSTNILLDDQLDAKVGDFGVSRLVPNGAQHISTVVQGTLGYLDPEYFHQTLQLTDKSDVYSLGVMLVELITSLKPVDTDHRDPQFSNLALLFLHHMKEGTLEEIIDPQLEIIGDSVSTLSRQAWRIRSSIFSVASLARRCLALTGHDRPSMMEVEHELREISHILHAT